MRARPRRRATSRPRSSRASVTSSRARAPCPGHPRDPVGSSREAQAACPPVPCPDRRPDRADCPHRDRRPGRAGSAPRRDHRQGRAGSALLRDRRQGRAGSAPRRDRRSGRVDCPHRDHRQGRAGSAPRRDRRSGRADCRTRGPRPGHPRDPAGSVLRRDHRRGPVDCRTRGQRPGHPRDPAGSDVRDGARPDERGGARPEDGDGGVALFRRNPWRARSPGVPRHSQAANGDAYSVLVPPKVRRPERYSFPWRTQRASSCARNGAS
jgi:hypothetical protein